MDIDGIKTLIKLNNELTAVNSRMQSLLGTESYLSSLIATESELQTQLDSFGFFDRIFKRKEYAELKKQSLPQTKEQISALQERVKDLPAVREAYSQLKGDMQLIQDNLNLPSSIIENISMFSINENGQLVFNIQDIEKIQIRYSKNEELTDDKKILIHKTGFFPKNNKILTNYDGKKTIPDCFMSNSNLFTYVSPVASCRQTSHYTLNYGVTSHTLGNWDGSNVVVLEEYSKHQEEFVNTEVTDSYTRGSLELSDSSLILVTRERYEQLSKEEQQKTNLIILDGANPELKGKDLNKAIATILKATGNIAIEPPGYNSVGHFRSEDKKYESVWETSSQVLKFLKSDKDVFDKDFTLSGEELNRYSFLMSKFGSNSLKYKIDNLVVKDSNGEECKIDERVLSTFLFSGLTRNEQGDFSATKDYDGLMTRLEALGKVDQETYKEELEKFVKENDLVSIQREIDRIQKEFDAQPEPTDEEVLNMKVSEIATFKNYKALCHLEECKNNVSAYVSNNGMYISHSFGEYTDEEGKVVIDYFQCPVSNEDDLTVGESLTLAKEMIEEESLRRLQEANQANTSQDIINQESFDEMSQ